MEILGRIATSVVRAGLSATDVFNSLDRDRDGLIGRTEFNQLCLMYEPQLTHRELDELFRFADADNNDFLDLHEFSAVLENARPMASTLPSRWLGESPESNRMNCHARCYAETEAGSYVRGLREPASTRRPAKADAMGLQRSHDTQMREQRLNFRADLSMGAVQQRSKAAGRPSSAPTGPRRSRVSDLAATWTPLTQQGHRIRGSGNPTEAISPDRLREVQIGGRPSHAPAEGVGGVRGPSATAEGDDDGAITAAVVAVMTLYDTEPADGQINIVEFRNLVHDLMCLRDGVLWQPPEQAIVIAEGLVKATIGSSLEDKQLSALDLVRLASGWSASFERLRLSGWGGKDLPALRDSTLPDRLQNLRERRSNERSTTASASENGSGVARELSGWVYTVSKCWGAAVGPDVLAEREGWRFNDHGDGTGVVYWWPPDGTPDRDKLLQDGILALSVQRLGTAAAPTVEDTPAQPALPMSARTINDPSKTLPLELDNVGSIKPLPKEGGLFVRVDRRLASLGLKSRDVGGGGDCFFRSLAAQHPELMHNPHLHMRARERTVAYLQEHKERFSDYTSSPYSAFLARLSNRGTWVEGEVELLAAASAWNVNIHLWGEDAEHDRRVQPPQPNNFTRTVSMAHYHDTHFRVVDQMEERRRLR